MADAIAEKPKQPAAYHRRIQAAANSHLSEHIVRALESGPKTWPEIVATFPAGASARAAQMIIGELQASGRVIGIGLEACGRTYRLRTAAEAGAISQVRTVPVTAQPIEAAVLIGEIHRVLASGASYDVSDLVRNVRGRFPSLDAGTMRAQIEALAAGNAIERLSFGSTFRYRKREPIARVG